MDTIQLSPSVLDWAAAQVGSSLYEFATRISKRSPEKIIKGVLTNAQVVKFSKTAGVPLGSLFMDEPPPPRTLPIVDFRTIQNAQSLSRDFFDTYDDIEFKQSWYRDMLIASGAQPLEFVGKFHRGRPEAQTLAKNIRTTIGFKDSDVENLKSADELFSMLATKCEQIGVLVFKNGVVGNNTHKALSVREFRGFALADEYAPVIFVNGADSSAAWAFTLAHELAHIFLGDSGVSDVDPAAENAVERYCNKVAAEFLVPKARFLSLWNEIGAVPIEQKIEIARSTFKVSSLVIARRALELGVTDLTVYAAVYERSLAHKKAGKSGGDFYKTLATRNSKKFSIYITSLAVSGVITLGQAGRLLNTNPNNVVKFYAQRNALSF